jgi:hypothetical protein
MLIKGALTISFWWHSFEAVFSHSFAAYRFISDNFNANIYSR